jgi:catechol 2,3-dioxygenase
MAQLGPQAAFFSAGGYHHHLGGNTWESAGASPPPRGTARLRHATVVLPDAAELDRIVARLAAGGRPADEREDGVAVADPAGNTLLLAVSG